jgi:hypothetical protein
MVLVPHLLFVHLVVSLLPEDARLWYGRAELVTSDVGIGLLFIR